MLNKSAVKHLTDKCVPKKEKSSITLDPNS